jgi:hypothetical protein
MWGKGSATPDDDVGARSANAVIGVLIVLPAALLLCFLAWKALRDAIVRPGPPSYVGEPQSSAEFYFGLFAVLGVIAAFLCNVAAKLLYGLITGRSVRALIPWWFAWGMLAVLSVVGLVGGVAAALDSGDVRQAGKGFAAAIFLVALLLGPARRLRARQRGG